MKFKKLDTVVLDRDVPERGLRRGDLGAIVEVYEPDGLEVEFVTASGRTQAIVTLKLSDVREIGQGDLIAVQASPLPMTAPGILEWLEGEVQGYPDRATGNECEDHIVRLAGRLVESDRSELVKAMREWIEQRGKRTLLAVRIAADLELCELKPAIQRLLEDVRAGKVLSPYYEEFIAPALKHI